MNHDLVTRKSVEDYNRKYDDELIYEEVVEQVAGDLDFAVESLLESIEDLKERFYYEQHKYACSSDYLNADTEIVDNCDFVNLALRAVEVSVKTPTSREEVQS